MRVAYSPTQYVQLPFTSQRAGTAFHETSGNEMDTADGVSSVTGAAGGIIHSRRIVVARGGSQR